MFYVVVLCIVIIIIYSRQYFLKIVENTEQDMFFFISHNIPCMYVLVNLACKIMIEKWITTVKHPSLDMEIYHP